MVQIPEPPLYEIGIFLFGFLLGMPAPYWYSQERIRGFIRAILSRAPYEPPPGEEAGEALENAVNAAAEAGGEEDGQAESDNSSN